MRPSLFLLFLVSVLTHGCLRIDTPYTMVAPGVWRGLLDLRDPASIPPHPSHTGPETEFDFSPTPEGVLPFHFEVEYPEPDSMRFTLINGEERIPVSKYSFTPNVDGEKGEIILYFPVYDTRIVARVLAGVMEGFWHVDYKTNYRIPFKAHLGERFRFSNSPVTPDEDITGGWEVEFSPGTADAYPAIGEFDQDGNRLTGTFITETGDYRYLEGMISDEEIFLSSFNGATAYLFEAKTMGPDQMIGVFYSGTHFHTTWEAKRNENFELRDPYMINAPADDQPVRFSAESISAETVDFDLSPYKDKVKIVEIMGSWCPNCHDATEFLKSWKEENPDLPVEIISLAFERYEDPEKSLKILHTYTEDSGISWPVVYGGSLSEAGNSPYAFLIDEIKAYPTFIIVDQENRIRNILTGFYGPATSEYDSFRERFDQGVREAMEP